MSGLSAKLEEPVDETADALADRRIGPKPDSAFEIGGIRAGLRNIARLHRKQLPGRWLAEGLLDEPHDLGHLDRFAITDIVDPPRCQTGCGVILGPGGIGRRRASQNAWMTRNWTRSSRTNCATSDIATT